MKRKLLKFSEIDKTMSPLVGGKGANLGEMTQAGFPVPDGFCITTEVYNDFSNNLDLENISAEKARELLEERELSDEIKKEIKEFLKEYPKDTLFSVRSSATAEDLPNASFAGQQDTYLNIKADEVIDAVKRCFISLFTDRAVAYRKENGITDSTMAVVVQKMVNSEKSGVLFSVDPVSGNRNKLLIDAIFGLGEAIVLGQVDPDSILIDKLSEKILEENIANKNFGLFTDKNGQTKKVELNTNEPVLNTFEIDDLRRLALELEQHYKAPQDIEWAIQDGKLYILQTRSITSLYPKPEFDDEKYHFLFNMGYQQMYPNAMPKLGLEVFKGLANIDRLNLDDYTSELIYPVGQHIFIDFSKVLSLKPIQKVFIKRLVQIIDPLIKYNLEQLVTEHSDLPHLKDIAYFKLIAKGVRQFPKFLLSKNPKYLKEETLRKINQNNLETIERIKSLDISSSSIRKLFLDLYFLDTFIENFIPMIFSSIFSLMRLTKIEEKLGRKGYWTTDFQIGNEGNIVTDMNLALEDLADFLVLDPQLANLLKQEKYLYKNKEIQTTNKNFDKEFNKFIQNYGFRGMGEIDISRKRWHEDIKPLINQILSLSKDKEVGSHRLKYLQQKIKTKEKAIDMIKTVREELGEKAALNVSREIERFRIFYSTREHLKYFWVRLYDTVRNYLLRTGEHLVSKEIIKNKEDIMHLKLDEIIEALETDINLIDLVEKRKQEFTRVAKLTPPRILTSEGEVLMGGLSKENIPEKALGGVGVSSGSVEGIAKVILDPNEGEINPGVLAVNLLRIYL